ncbi:FxLD family lanthipeptide [Longispora sp. NPDC051575]
MNDLLTYTDADGDPFDLDVTVVLDGPPAAARLSATDDNCDTKKPGDC